MTTAGRGAEAQVRAGRSRSSIGPVLAAAVALALLPPAPAAAAQAPGTIATVAGGTGAGDARLVSMEPTDLAVQGGFLYAADDGGEVVRRIDVATHQSTVVAGNGTVSFRQARRLASVPGDGGPATASRVSASAVAADEAGNIYVGDGDRIRRVTPGGTITTWTGGQAVLDGGRGTRARTAANEFNVVADLDLDPSGNLLVADARSAPGGSENGLGTIRRITTGGSVELVAGGMLPTGPAGDGAKAVDAPVVVRCVGHDGSGNVLVCDNDRVRRISSTGTITTIAGGGQAGTADGPATAATLIPEDVAVAPNGDIYIADAYSRRVRKLVGGTISSLPTLPATLYDVHQPTSLAVDSAGRTYAAMGPGGVIWRLESGEWQRFAGTGTPGGSDAPAETALADAQITAFAFARAPDGTIYLDEGRLRRITPAGQVEVLPEPKPSGPMAVGIDGRLLVGGGDGLYRRKTDGTWEKLATVPSALDLAVLPNGDALIAPYDGNKVWRVTMAGAVSPFAGTGTDGFSGDGGPATSAKIGQVGALGCDGAGNVWMATNGRIRKVTTGGTISTAAGNGTFPDVGAADGSSALANGFASISDLVVSVDGTSVFLTERPFSGAGQVRRIRGGVLTTVAGGRESIDGLADGRPANTVGFWSPGDLALEPDGSLLVLDDANGAFAFSAQRLYRVVPPAGTTPVAGAPGAPKVTSAGIGSLGVSWTAPTSGAGAVVGYRVRVGVGGPNYQQVLDIDVPGTGTSATVPSNGAPNAVQVRVAAITGAGQGPWSAGVVAAPPFVSPAADVQRQYQDFTGRAPTSAELFSGVDMVTSLIFGSAVPAESLFSEAGRTVGPVTRLFSAYFLRLPDAGGLTYWVGKLRKGTSLGQISASFAASSEFQNRYGSLSPTAFVKLVYQNVLGRQPDSGGLNYWVKRLNEGTSRGVVMTNFSESSENLRKTATLTTLTTGTFSMLHRPPTTSEVAWWKALGNVDSLDVVRAVMTSSEYDALV